MSKLSSLFYVIINDLSWETPASKEQKDRIENENKSKEKHERIILGEGFAEGSPIYKECKELGLELIQYHHYEPPQKNLDMFDVEEELIKRYVVDFQPPYPFGGVEPPDVYDVEAPTELMFGAAVAWDEETVVFECPRGFCKLPRREWGNGRRRCSGC